MNCLTMDEQPPKSTFVVVWWNMKDDRKWIALILLILDRGRLPCKYIYSYIGVVKLLNCFDLSGFAKGICECTHTEYIYDWNHWHILTYVTDFSWIFKHIAAWMGHSFTHLFLVLFFWFQRCGVLHNPFVGIWLFMLRWNGTVRYVGPIWMTGVPIQINDFHGFFEYLIGLTHN